MLSEAFWTPNIASSQFDEYSQLGSRRKVRPIKNQLGSPTTPNYVREQTFAQLRTGLRLIRDGEKGDEGDLIYIYVHTHTHTHTHTHARTHARKHARTHARTHAHTHTHTQMKCKLD